MGFPYDFRLVLDPACREATFARLRALNAENATAAAAAHATAVAAPSATMPGVMSARQVPPIPARTSPHAPIPTKGIPKDSEGILLFQDLSWADNG